MGPHSSIGAPAKYNHEAPEGGGGGGACLGASLGPRGRGLWGPRGASNSLAPALDLGVRGKK